MRLTLAWIENGRAFRQDWQAEPGDRGASSPDGILLADLLSLPALDRVLPADLLAALRAGQGGCSVHGRRRGPTDRILDGERLELLPPLQVDPKLARQRRVQARRLGGGRDPWNTQRGTQRDPDSAGGQRRSRTQA